MENCLYRKTIMPAKLSEDGESPTVLYVTKEANGYGVFLTGYHVDYGTLLKWFTDRDEAIEYGVAEAEARLIVELERQRKAA